MKITRSVRRTLLGTALALTVFSPALLHAAGSTQADTPDFPSKPVKLVVPYPAGGIVDISARIIAEGLSQQWQQPVVIENRPGGNANIGAEVVRKAKPDGYTLLVGSSFLVLNPLTDSATRYRTRDFTPVVELGSAPMLLAAPTALGVRSLQEFVAQAKARPQQLNAAIPGINTSNKLVLDHVFAHYGVQLESVLYQGQPPYLADLANNRVQIASVTSTLALPFIQSGQLQPLAAASAQRIPAFPDLPTLSELGIPNADVAGFSGLFAPQGTSEAVVARIRSAVERIHRDPKLVAKLEAQHLYLPDHARTQSFASVVQQDLQRWSRHFSVALVQK